MELLRQFNMLPHWDRSCRSNLPPHPVTFYWHRADQSQNWPYNTRRLAGQPLECQFLSHWYDSTPEKSRRKWDSNPGSSALEADALTTRPTRRQKKKRRRNTYQNWYKDSWLSLLLQAISWPALKELTSQRQTKHKQTHDTHSLRSFSSFLFLSSSLSFFFSLSLLPCDDASPPPSLFDLLLSFGVDFLSSSDDAGSVFSSAFGSALSGDLVAGADVSRFVESELVCCTTISGVCLIYWFIRFSTSPLSSWVREREREKQRRERERKRERERERERERDRQGRKRERERERETDRQTKERQTDRQGRERQTQTEERERGEREKRERERERGGGVRKRKESKTQWILRIKQNKK